AAMYIMQSYARTNVSGYGFLAAIRQGAIDPVNLIGLGVGFVTAGAGGAGAAAAAQTLRMTLKTALTSAVRNLITKQAMKVMAGELVAGAVSGGLQSHMEQKILTKEITLDNRAFQAQSAYHYGDLALGAGFGGLTAVG